MAADKAKNGVEVDGAINSQNIPLLRAESSPARASFNDISIVGGVAIASETGPLGTIRDVEDVGQTNHQISTYTVREGDSIASIAKMYGVSSNTIIWANDIKGKTIKEGQILVILPVSGVLHTVKKGDTLQSLAKKYKADIDEIIQYNDLERGSGLVAGDIITVPDGEIVSIVAVKPSTSAGNSKLVRGYDGASYEGYYIRPLAGGTKTQGLHGYNGVDLGASVGTPVFASAGGTVIIARSSGWNAGYGNYVVISHMNGTQTLYAHLSRVRVYSGQLVERGDLIGNVGSTGKSTGPHLHFEVRGAKNPF